MRSKNKVGQRVRVIQCLSNKNKHEGKVGIITTLYNENDVEVWLNNGDYCFAIKTKLLNPLKSKAFLNKKDQALRIRTLDKQYLDL